MNTCGFRLLGLFALASAIGLSPELVLAQQPLGGGKKDEKPVAPVEPPGTVPEFQVIRLKHASAVDCAQVLSDVVGAGPQHVRIVAEPVTNSLLVAGTPGQLATITQLIPKLDIEAPGSEKPSAKMAVFTLQHVKADNTLAEALRLVLRSPHGAFSLNPGMNQVAVRADPKILEEVERLLRQLDDQARGQASLPTPEVQVRVVWLASGLPKGAPKPPADLKDVVDELAKIDVDDLRLVSQSVVKTMIETQFTLAGSGMLDAPCELSIQGSVSIRDRDQPTLQIQIDATRQTVDPKVGTAKVMPVCRVSTNILAPPGQSIVLGVTPSENLTSVFIVQLMPPKQAKPAAARK
jgi:hypothetical protein